MKDKIRNQFPIPLITVGIINLILFIVKLYIGIRTNSLCIYTDSINNLLDSISAIIACVSSILITKAATKRHPFGFGRIEYILEFVMSLIIALAGAYFAYTSLQRLSMPTPVWFYYNFAIILGISCLIKLGIAFVFYKLYKKTDSVIFKTVMFDSLLDTGVTLVALVSFSLSNKTGIVLDGFLGLAISIIIIISGIKLTLSSVSKLIGTNDSKEIDDIESTIKSIDKDIQIKNILINDYGVECKYITIFAKYGNKNREHLTIQIKDALKNKKYKYIGIELEE